MKKIIRSICYFSDESKLELYERLTRLAYRLEQNDFEIQTQRVVFSGMSIAEVNHAVRDKSLFIGVGTLTRESALPQIDDFLGDGNVAFNLDITRELKLEDVDILFEIMRRNASKTFNFAFTVNTPPSTPFFPSATYEKIGFALGLQSTDLSASCGNIDEWLANMTIVWDELMNLFSDEADFLGIDSSVAPLWQGKSSLVAFIERVYQPFPMAVTTDIFTRISSFVRARNPRPVGLCGLMFPCLEDAELARQYSEDNFTMERNLFLSMHCGLGIDTYPIGMDESPERVLEILQLLRALSNRYHKPLSARFVSDGTAKIGDKTDFKNQYLQDVVVRKL